MKSSSGIHNLTCFPVLLVAKTYNNSMPLFHKYYQCLNLQEAKKQILHSTFLALSNCVFTFILFIPMYQN